MASAPEVRGATGPTTDHSAETAPTGVLLHMLQDTFVRSVVKRLMSDAPLGVLLSGGLDSSLVASVAVR